MDWRASDEDAAAILNISIRISIGRNHVIVQLAASVLIETLEGIVILAFVKLVSAIAPVRVMTSEDVLPLSMQTTLLDYKGNYGVKESAGS